MGFKYFKLKWPESPIPEGEPHYMYYEVDTSADNVLRLVEQMQSGELFKNSLAHENKIGPPVISLFEEKFSSVIGDVAHEFVSQQYFDTLYSKAVQANVTN